MQNNRWQSILLVIILSAVSAFAVTLPERAPAEGAWEENAVLNLSFAAAKVRVRSRFESAGYKMVHEIAMGKKNNGLLMLWEKDGTKTIVMLWRIDVNKTGYSRGEIKPETVPDSGKREK